MDSSLLSLFAVQMIITIKIQRDKRRCLWDVSAYVRYAVSSELNPENRNERTLMFISRMGQTNIY